MLNRPLSCLLAAFALAAVSCGGGGSTNSSSTRPSIFLDRDLHGDWIGFMTPDGGVETVAYLRCADNGDPFAGADASGRDWVSDYPYSHAVVKPDGDAFLSYVVGREVFYLEGQLTRTGTLTGSYWTLFDGIRSEEGFFEFQLSVGSGNFTASNHLAGSWSGSASNDTGDVVNLTLELGADGSLVAASRDGSSVDLGASTATLSFSDDGLGRLHSFSLVFLDGNQDQLDFALVSDDGMELAGPATDSVFGTMDMVLQHD